MVWTGYNEKTQKRSSLHVHLAIPIEALGTDLQGTEFLEHAATDRVSCAGAIVLLRQVLAPEQVLLIRCGQREAEFRVVGQIGMMEGKNIYAVSFVDTAVKGFWGISFPGDAEKEEPVKAFLECIACRKRTIVELSELEFVVMGNSGRLLRNCPACRDATFWRTASHDVADSRSFGGAVPAKRAVPKPEPPTSPASLAATDRRQRSRVKVGMKACIRCAGQEEVVQVLDMSPSGFRFFSRKQYASHSFIEVAIPYTRDADNIFVSARVVWHRKEGAASEHGAKYAKA